MLSFKSKITESISESIKKSAEIETQKCDELAKTIVFGKYYQTDEGIYVKGDDVDKRVAEIKMLSVKVHIDELGLFEPKIDWTYENLLYGKTIELTNMTKSEIEANISSDIAFQSDKSIKPFIESVLHSEWENVTYEKGVFIEGFFYHEGKVIDNTVNKDLEYTSHDVKDAIKMVNAIISDRGTAKNNDATVMRFMLASPFMYCLKQIGFGKANYGLMLYGKPQTSKTGSVSNFSWFYSEPTETDKAVSTLSVFGSRLEETTLPSLIDEAYSFISDRDNHDSIKRSIYSETTRQVKSKNDNRKTDNYKALSIPIFTYNEHYEVADYFGRRFILCYYDETMVINDEDRKAFDVEYVPNSPQSPLVDLRCLGKEFSKRFIPYIEKRERELMDIEKLTVKILKEIASDFHTDFDSAIYNIQESNTDTTIDLKSKIKNGLNELFRRNHRLKYGNSFYGEDDFRASANNREIPFLYYKPKKEVYVIQSKSFVDTISNLVNETLNLDEIASYLEIDVSEESQQKVYGQNIGYGFELSESDLQLKVFGIRIYESSKINSDEDDDVDESKDDTDKSESEAIDQD